MCIGAGRRLAAAGAAVVLVGVVLGAAAPLADPAAGSAGGAPAQAEGPAASSARAPAQDVEAARLGRITALLEDHGVDLVAVTDDQPCEGQPEPFVDAETGQWQTTGCHTTGEGVRLSEGVLSPVVPWEDVEYLVLHEAAHEAEKAAGCEAVMTVEDRERLADAVAVRYGADPTVTTHGPTKADYMLADRVLEDGTCG